ncbi:hypothetical protein Mapa_017172 [Marchantia paleacea]|nr:hypothetical protein Mapa_017172 [Marchantia paleacea]
MRLQEGLRSQTRVYSKHPTPGMEMCTSAIYKRPIPASLPSWLQQLLRRPRCLPLLSHTTASPVSNFSAFAASASASASAFAPDTLRAESERRRKNQFARTLPSSTPSPFLLTLELACSGDLPMQ